MTTSVLPSPTPLTVNCFAQPDVSAFHSNKPERVYMQFQPLRRRIKAAASGQMGLGLQLQPTYGKGLAMSSSRIKSSSVICAFASNARCSQSQGQTQTVTRESPTITQAPVHSKEKSPELDDGGTGFPPRDDGDGGGIVGGTERL
ncbi:uncharacterized protein LOC110806627 [Carica papaya]|uniref:uncharacterized protein LOC110806627 n=1 Tax=Carica papaya TaxID=3649 RepID=UPI000B8C9E9C|nr:uncharacterized protein LOC110806627 [Carica papaya]